MKSITIERAKSITADEVCEGKITRHDATMGKNIGQPPSRHMRRCFSLLNQVQNFRLGTMSRVCIFDWRSASTRARYITSATFSISEG